MPGGISMGLFDKRDKIKRRDDFDSPVERVDLDGGLEGGAAAPGEPSSPMMAQPAASASAPEPEPEPEPELGSFGIDKAIQLMRTLPTDNIELVVQVVKLTLESTKIKITTIIDDASRRQDEIQARIKVLRDEIADFEKEIASRREEISGLEADHTETSMVKDRLQLAEKLTQKGHSPITSGGKDKAAAAGAIGSGGGLPRPSGALPAASPPAGGTPGTHTVVAKK